MEKIILFYKYVTIDCPQRILKWQRRLCGELGLKGRTILATEGINSTLGGTAENIERYKKAMEAHQLFKGIDYKEGSGSVHDFPRMRIVIKNEIVRLGIDPNELTVADGGQHLTPTETHELLQNKPKDLVIIDCRNQHESAIGTFTGSMRPNTKTFREFPEYIDNNAEQLKDKKVLMFCTGGIRCERASGYVKQKTEAKKVYQIKGGIHRYIEQYPNGFFRGKNYVFDGRIAVKVNGDILGSCYLCDKPCDDYTNCFNAECNKHYISCVECTQKFNNTCGQVCKELLATGKVKQRPLFNKEKFATQNNQTTQENK